MLSGVDRITSRSDLFARLTLLSTEVGLYIEHEDQKFFNEIDDSVVDRAIADGSSDHLLECIRRFASIEGNCFDSNLKGLGRISSQGFPRLGGVLNSEMKKNRAIPEAIVAAVERTIHAGYLAAATLTKAGESAVVVTDIDQLWNDWIPLAYPMNDHGSNLVFSNCALDDFWSSCLEQFGFTKALKKMKSGRVSDIAASIGGLATTGVGLFSAERPIKQVG
jgi:hypothetical protein